MHTYYFTAKIEGFMMDCMLTTDDPSYERPFEGELKSNNVDPAETSVQATGKFIAKKNRHK